MQAIKCVVVGDGYVLDASFWSNCLIMIKYCIIAVLLLKLHIILQFSPTERVFRFLLLIFYAYFLYNRSKIKSYGEMKLLRCCKSCLFVFSIYKKTFYK